METIFKQQRHSLGVEKIDGAHYQFVTQVHSLVASSDEEFPALFLSLIIQTREHFLDEANMMRETSFGELRAHEREHLRVLEELQQLNRSVKLGRISLVRSYVRDTLTNWFETHLTLMDNSLALHLAQQ